MSIAIVCMIIKLTLRELPYVYTPAKPAKATIWVFIVHTTDSECTKQTIQCFFKWVNTGKPKTI